jgi:alcohol dehydrogenase
MEFPFPHISGTDASGVVEAVGSAVRRTRVGDEVLVNGSFGCGECHRCSEGNPFDCPDFHIWGFDTGPMDGAQAEYARVPARCLIPKPANLSFEEAGSMCVTYGTAWRMLAVRAKIKPGDFVLIWGAAGGLGSMAIQICRLFQAHPIAVVSSDDKRAFCESIGAEYVINRKTQRILREVGRITAKRGVDVVFEHTGADTWETGCLALRWGGTVVTCGATSGYKAPLDIRFLWTKQLNYLGSHCCTVSEYAEALRFVGSGAIKPVVTEVMPLAEIARAHTLLEQGGVCGKIVLTP